MFFILVTLVACKQQSSTENDVSDGVDTTRFFQVKDYFQNQVAEVNKTPFFIYKIVTVDGNRDSVPIDTRAFTELAKQFLQPDINDPLLKHFYHESVFRDQTTNSYTLSYNTANKTLPVQTIDVLLRDDAETVKRVFIRKFYHNSDSSVIEQLSWKHNEQFQVSRLVQTPDKKETSQQTLVVWNNQR